MAERASTSNVINAGMKETVWTGLLNGDTGDWIDVGPFADRTVQITGTPGTGGTLVIQGSNEPTTPTAFWTLTNQGGTALSFTAAGGALVAEGVRWIRPSVTAGDGSTNFTVRMISRQ